MKIWRITKKIALHKEVSRSEFLVHNLLQHAVHELVKFSIFIVAVSKQKIVKLIMHFNSERETRSGNLGAGNFIVP